MTNPLLQALEKLKREEQAKKKKTPVFNIQKEKRLQYYPVIVKRGEKRRRFIRRLLRKRDVQATPRNLVETALFYPNRL